MRLRPAVLVVATLLLLVLPYAYAGVGFEIGFNAGPASTIKSVTGIPEYVRTVRYDQPSDGSPAKDMVVPDSTNTPFVMRTGQVWMAGVAASGNWRFRLGVGLEGEFFEQFHETSSFSDVLAPGMGVCQGNPPTYRDQYTPSHVRCYNEYHDVDWRDEAGAYRVTRYYDTIFVTTWSGNPGSAIGGLEYRFNKNLSVTGNYALSFYKLHITSGIDSYDHLNLQKYTAWAHTHSVSAGLRFYFAHYGDGDIALEAMALRNFFGVSNSINGVPGSLRATGEGAWNFRIGLAMQWPRY